MGCLSDISGREGGRASPYIGPWPLAFKYWVAAGNVHIGFDDDFGLFSRVRIHTTDLLFSVLPVA